MSLKSKLQQINYKRVAYHILFWLVLSFFYDFISSWLSNRSFFDTLIHDLLFFFPSDILGVYFTLYFLFPKFLLKKKYISFTVWFLVFFSLLMFVVTMPLQYYGIFFIKTNVDHFVPNYKQYLEYNFLWAITIKLMIIGVASAIKLAKIWYKTQIRQQALNNLYSLTLQKSGKAPEVVLKISSLLNYVLYECNVPKIELDREIDNIENYIDLQKIRYDDKVNIILNIQGEPSEITIAPLLILPIIENAFKHGLDKNAGNGFINININVSDDSKFYLTVTNSLNGENNHEGEGIGLSNLKKRLELQYPEKHKFSHLISNNQYITNLCLDLY